MLLKDEIRHNQRSLALNQARSRRLTLAQDELMSLLDLLRAGLSLAQPLHEGSNSGAWLYERVLRLELPSRILR
jgi:hypothetical protein